MNRTLRDLTDGEYVELKKIIDFFSTKYGSLAAIGNGYDLPRYEMSAAKMGFRTFQEYCVAKARERSERIENIRFASYLRRRIDELGINMNKLAVKSGLRKQRIHQYVSGGYFPNNENMKKLADGLEVSVEMLYEARNGSL